MDRNTCAGVKNFTKSFQIFLKNENAYGVSWRKFSDVVNNAVEYNQLATF